jgi:hypothetical protein
MDNSRTPADLIACSKQKYTLSQARLQPGKVELALLSLQGSLEDGLRSYLLLHGHTAARDDFSALLTALCDYTPLALSQEHVRRIRRMHDVRDRIIQGEAVTLTDESLSDYQQIVAEVLVRYGVLVVAPEQRTATQSSYTTRQPRERRGDWRNIFRKMAEVASLLLLIFLLGIGVLLVIKRVVPDVSLININQTATTTAITPVPVSPMSVRETEPPQHTPESSPDRLSPGQTAVVRVEADEMLALRERPGTASNNPVKLYLSPDTVVRVIEGPVHVNGLDWWKVRAANLEGWSRGDALEAR